MRLSRSFSCRVKDDSEESGATGGAEGVQLCCTLPVLSESSSEKDCFLLFRTWLELMQLQSSCKPI